MSTAAAPEVAPPAEVSKFLQRHHAEASFEKVCALVRQCFPDASELRFRLLDDPDTEDRVWLIIQFNLPAALACTRELRNREVHYHERFVTEIPLDQCPLFAVHWQFIADQE